MKVQLKQDHGTPTVFINEQPVFFGCHLVGSMDPLNPNENQAIVRKYAEAGVHIYSVDNLNPEWCGPRPGNPSPYDFSPLIPRLQSYIDVDPQAMFLMRMGLDTRSSPGNWWNLAYPDEVEVLSDGGRYCNSFASSVWVEQVNALLVAFIDVLKQSGYYERVVGFQIGAGTNGEWIKDMSSMMQPTMDYSRPMQRHFRQWLHEKYTDDNALRSAWADPSASLEIAEVPTFHEQATTSTGHSFRDPLRERNVIDYFTCFSELCADDLLSFCHTVRQATQGEKLIGAFFGYLMDLAWNMAFFANQGSIEDSEVSTMQRSGHLGLHQVLHSPDIDYLVSPHGYAFRGMGGDGLPMQPAEALRHHGKIYIMEEDALMHNNFDPGGRNQSVENSISVYQRNFAQVLTHAHGVTWFEVNSLQEDPRLVDERKRWIQRFMELGTWGLNLNRTPASEVAVLIDDESYYYESIQNNLDIPLIWRQRAASLNRFGAPHDIYLLDDLLDGTLPDYKLYVFLNPFHLNDRRRKALQDIVQKDGKVSLWLYAPGFINSDRSIPLHREHMTELTGFHFGQGDAPWGPMMHLTNFTHPITQGLPQDWFWGSTNPIGPLFHIEDTEACTLGQVVYALGRCKPGFGVKEFNLGDPSRMWRSVYLSSPDIPAPVLRGIASYAGVHLYNEEGDVLYATPELLSVHTIAGGYRHFKLPHPVEMIYDLFEKKIVADHAKTFDVTLPPASTALFYLGEKAKISTLL